MAQVGYGPLMFVDGPLPIPPRYSLIKAARQAPGGDGDRWINGTSMWAYGAQAMGLHDPCAVDPAEKAPDVDDIPRRDTGTITQWLAETCTSASVAGDIAAYRERAQRMYAARESYLVERELLHADLLPDNPHLGDANVTVLNGGGAASPLLGLEELDGAIADSKEAGFIHCTAKMLVAWTGALGGPLKEENGKLLSPNGNIIIPGAGYDGEGPDGSDPIEDTLEWAYASGPVEIRMTDIVMFPDDVAQALDRRQNRITYYAERYYNVVWSPLVQAAILIDRCQTGCAPA